MATNTARITSTEYIVLLFCFVFIDYLFRSHPRVQNVLRMCGVRVTPVCANA